MVDSKYSYIVIKTKDVTTDTAVKAAMLALHRCKTRGRMGCVVRHWKGGDLGSPVKEEVMLATGEHVGSSGGGRGVLPLPKEGVGKWLSRLPPSQPACYYPCLDRILRR